MANDEVDRRSAILNAAVECFGTLGYYGTSLQRIATMVNLTKPGVLHYVGSKEGLLHAVLDEMYDRETEDVTAALNEAGIVATFGIAPGPAALPELLAGTKRNVEATCAAIASLLSVARECSSRPHQ